MTTLTNNGAPFLIGSLQTPGDWSWDGKLDDIFIFDKALSDTEITSLYNGSTSQNNLQGFWNFNEGSGNTAFDISGNGYNGTITNAFYDNNTPQNNNSVLWSTGETTSSITAKPSATTTYTVDVTSGSTTCQSDVTITVCLLYTSDAADD